MNCLLQADDLLKNRFRDRSEMRLIATAASKIPGGVGVSEEKIKEWFRICRPARKSADPGE